jgi:LacI family transcriptional regulator
MPQDPIVSGLLNRQVAGMIVVPTGADQSYLARKYAGVPVVCVDRPPVGIECDTVLVDNEGGTFLGTNWLISHGHRRIAFVGGPKDQFTIDRRRQGYSRALREAGIALDPDLLADVAILPSDVSAVIPSLLALSDPITAVFTSNSKASLGAIDALHRLGRTDVAMVGFDDFPTAASLVPPITVVSQDPFHIGREAVELLLHRIAGEHESPGRMLLPTSLVVRGSGELRPSQRKARAAQAPAKPKSNSVA